MLWGASSKPCSPPESTFFLSFSMFFLVCSTFFYSSRIATLNDTLTADGFQDFSNNVFHRHKQKNLHKSSTGGAAGPGRDRSRGLALPPCAGGPVPGTTALRGRSPGPGVVRPPAFRWGGSG